MGTAVGSLFRTWLPTAFGSSMLVVEIPLVYAAVARSAGGGRELAALGVCVALLVVVNTPALAVTPLVVVELDRQPARRLWRYALVVGAGGALVLLALAALPVAGPLTGGQPGLDSGVRAGLICLAPNALGVAMRRYLHGRLIGAVRTGVLVPATIARIGGSGALAWVGVAALPGHGAAVGASALSVGRCWRPRCSAWPHAGCRRRGRPRVSRSACWPAGTRTCPARGCCTWCAHVDDDGGDRALRRGRTVADRLAGALRAGDAVRLAGQRLGVGVRAGVARRPGRIPGHAG